MSVWLREKRARLYYLLEEASHDSTNGCVAKQRFYCFNEIIFPRVELSTSRHRGQDPLIPRRRHAHINARDARAGRPGGRCGAARPHLLLLLLLSPHARRIVTLR